MDDSDLSFESALGKYTRLYYGANQPEKIDDFVVKRAQCDHALAVFNPLRDTFLEATQIAPKIKNKNANYYMLYGAGRRLQILFFAYRELIFTAPADREEPLNTEESRSLVERINSIYMHLRGVFDNYAWCLLYEADSKLANETAKSRVGLFKPIILKNEKLSKINSFIGSFKEWNNEVTKLRDPVAHRIPLTIPPSIVTSKEGDKYQKMYAEYMGAVGAIDFDKAENILDRLNEIGKFVPMIVHHPDEQKDWLYPTVPNDLANLVKISREIFKFLS